MRTILNIVVICLIIPFSVLGQQKVWEEVFVETFSPNRMDWPTVASDQMITKIDEGRFSFSHVSEGLAKPLARDVPMLLPDEYAIEAELSYIKGDGSGYRLMFNYSDSRNFHYVNISNNGYYMYGYYLDGKSYTRVPWTETSLNPIGFTNRMS